MDMQPAMKSLKQSYPNISTKETHFEMSVYKGELSKIAIVEGSVKIRKCFPDLDPGFFDIFSDRLKENNFSDERLKDSINHVIDNCIYPKPTIAQFISYDKKIKLYTYNQVLQMNQEFSGKAFNYYKAVKVQEGQKTPVYVHVNDVEIYKLEQWEKQ